jgi:hypothetical protein
MFRNISCGKYSLPIALLYLKEPFTLDCIWAALCLVGVVYFIF